MLFNDRADAGRQLAKALAGFARDDPVVVGLPRGGVPVAFEVARSLGAPLDVIVVRKLGVPYRPELGMGAVGESGSCVVNRQVMALTGVSEDVLAVVEQRETAAVAEAAARFRGDRPPVPLLGRTVIVVDDGIATGSTARAACRLARARGAARVVLAVPVAPKGTERRMRPDADDVICLVTPRQFGAVSRFYDDFGQVPDDQVMKLLDLARGSRADPL